MRLYFLTFTVFCVLAPVPPAMAMAPEFITVPAEAVVKVEKEDYAGARAKAISIAFNYSAQMVVAGLATGSELFMKKEIIENRIIKRGADFVKSYKFLEENVDPAKGYLQVRLQVTLFLDDIRHEMRVAGIRAKKRSLPKLIVLIDERNIGFFSGENILLLKSLSEEILAQYFQDRGYQVVTRKNIVANRLEKTAIEALKANTEAITRLSYEMEVDMLIVGKVNVEARPSAGGESIEAVVKVGLFLGENGETLWTHSERSMGVYDKVLEGSLDVIRSATSLVARQLAIKTARAWREAKDRTNE